MVLSFSSFSTWSADGSKFWTLRLVSLITVATMKKNRSINTMSGKDAAIGWLEVTMSYNSAILLFFSASSRAVFFSDTVFSFCNKAANLPSVGEKKKNWIEVILLILAVFKFWVHEFFVITQKYWCRFVQFHGEFYFNIIINELIYNSSWKCQKS